MRISCVKNRNWSVSTSNGCTKDTLLGILLAVPATACTYLGYKFWTLKSNSHMQKHKLACVFSLTSAPCQLQTDFTTPSGVCRYWSHMDRDFSSNKAQMGKAKASLPARQAIHSLPNSQNPARWQSIIWLEIHPTGWKPIIYRASNSITFVKAIEAGETILSEAPLVAMQHCCNKHEWLVCSRCCKFLGSVELQAAWKLRFTG